MAKKPLFFFHHRLCLPSLTPLNKEVFWACFEMLRIIRSWVNLFGASTTELKTTKSSKAPLCHLFKADKGMNQTLYILSFFPDFFHQLLDMILQEFHLFIFPSMSFL